jgi:hypothetical protein
MAAMVAAMTLHRLVEEASQSLALVHGIDGEVPEVSMPTVHLDVDRGRD